MTIETIQPLIPIVCVSDKDLKDVVSHEDDPIMMLVIITERNIHRVLIGQGSLTEIMFWDTYVGFQILQDQLKPLDGVLVSFSGEQVEV